MADPGIGTLVRHWLHYSNLSSSLYKQFCAAKKVQDEYVAHIIGTLQKMKMEKAILQIGDGHITMYEKKTPHPLSLKLVEQFLHEYYKQVGGKDCTKEIMLFINANRKYNVQNALRKTGIAGVASTAALPGPM
jgi:hypothetical protein